MDGHERLPREDVRLLRERGADPRVGWEWLQRPEVLGRRPWMQRLLERVCERKKGDDRSTVALKSLG
jgi:hypothetical protein